MEGHLLAFASVAIGPSRQAAFFGPTVANGAFDPLRKWRVHRSSRDHVDSCSGGRAHHLPAADHAKGIALPVQSNGLLRQEIVD